MSVPISAPMISSQNALMREGKGRRAQRTALGVGLQSVPGRKTAQGSVLVNTSECASPHQRRCPPCRRGSIQAHIQHDLAINSCRGCDPHGLSKQQGGPAQGAACHIDLRNLYHDVAATAASQKQSRACQRGLRCWERLWLDTT
eukprot:12410240-Karenia_brevis.AAC.1